MKHIAALALALLCLLTCARAEETVLHPGENGAVMAYHADGSALFSELTDTGGLSGLRLMNADGSERWRFHLPAPYVTGSRFKAREGEKGYALVGRTDTGAPWDALLLNENGYAVEQTTIPADCMPLAALDTGVLYTAPYDDVTGMQTITYESWRGQRFGASLQGRIADSQLAVFSANTLFFDAMFAAPGGSMQTAVFSLDLTTGAFAYHIFGAYDACQLQAITASEYAGTLAVLSFDDGQTLRAVRLDTTCAVTWQRDFDCNLSGFAAHIASQNRTGGYDIYGTDAQQGTAFHITLSDTGELLSGETGAGGGFIVHYKNAPHVSIRDSQTNAVTLRPFAAQSGGTSPFSKNAPHVSIRDDETNAVTLHPFAAQEGGTPPFTDPLAATPTPQPTATPTPIPTVANAKPFVLTPPKDATFDRVCMLAGGRVAGIYDADNYQKKFLFVADEHGIADALDISGLRSVIMLDASTPDIELVADTSARGESAMSFERMRWTDNGLETVETYGSGKLIVFRDDSILIKEDNGFTLVKGDGTRIQLDLTDWPDTYFFAEDGTIRANIDHTVYALDETGARLWSITIENSNEHTNYQFFTDGANGAWMGENMSYTGDLLVHHITPDGKHDRTIRLRGDERVKHLQCCVVTGDGAVTLYGTSVAHSKRIYQCFALHINAADEASLDVRDFTAARSYSIDVQKSPDGVIWFIEYLLSVESMALSPFDAMPAAQHNLSIEYE